MKIIIGRDYYIEKVQDRYSWMGVGVFTSHCSSFMHEDFEAAEAAAKYELGREAEFTGESNEDRAAAIDAGPQAVSLAMKKLNNNSSPEAIQ